MFTLFCNRLCWGAYTAAESTVFLAGSRRGYQASSTQPGAMRGVTGTEMLTTGTAGDSWKREEIYTSGNDKVSVVLGSLALSDGYDMLC